MNFFQTNQTIHIINLRISDAQVLKSLSFSHGITKSILEKTTRSTYEKNRQKGKPFTVRHFIEMGLKRRSIYNIIIRIENNIHTIEKI